ncbi:MAG: putative selenium-dependent hydroxylase accessory protein YqeC [Deltaproteobacteria bacterium]|nr:putative selenium-dependent hydroxylase accessory protein YqeC [Deltaproteobacteria bacterium]
MSGKLIDKLCLKDRGVISLIGAGGKTSLMFRLAKELENSGKTVLTTTTTKIFMPDRAQSPYTIVANSFDKILDRTKSSLHQYRHFSAGSVHDQAAGKLNGFSPGIIDQLWEKNLFDWIIVEADGAKQKSLKATALHEPVVPGTTTRLVLVTGLDAVGKILDDKIVHRAKLFSNNTGLLPGEAINEQSIATSIAFEIKKAGLFLPFLNFVFLNKADNKSQIKSGEKIAGLLQTNGAISRVIIASLKDKAPLKNNFNCKKINNKRKK